jgi:ethanolamine utilization protein EutN
LGARSSENGVSFTEFFPLHEILRRHGRLMEIMQVSDTLVCTYRVAGLDHMHLRILVNNKGKKLVAVDPVGARKGNWVFTASGSAARHACPDSTVLTDLTIGGIIDHWTPDG